MFLFVFQKPMFVKHPEPGFLLDVS